MSAIPAKNVSKRVRETIKELIYCATRAPSGHNTQPWKFAVEDDIIEIHPDFSRSLPVADPQHRELYISLGTALENLCTAALRFGYLAQWSIEPAGQEAYFIRVNLHRSSNRSDVPLFKYIEKRQTNRSVFSGKIISPRIIEELKAVSREDEVNVYFFKRGTPSFDTLKDLVQKGNAIQMQDRAFKKELLHWIRFNQSHIDRTGDGLTYRVMGSPPTPKWLGRMIIGSFLNPKAQNKADEQRMDSSSHLVVLTTTDHTIPHWISLGVYLERLLLSFTAEEIAFSYLNQPCQIAEVAREMQKTLPLNGEFPSIVLRLGYGAPVAYSPRREVGEVLV